VQALKTSGMKSFTVVPLFERRSIEAAAGALTRYLN
jgi:hypothetical protein